MFLPMDEETRKRLEYEEQLFGMSSMFFSDCFKKLLKDELESKVTQLTNNIRKKLLHQAKNPEQFDAAIQKMKEGLFSEYLKALHRLFPEMAAKISKFVNVPSNILLKEDLCVRNGINGNLNEIKLETETLKGTFASLLYLKQKLMEELQEADSAILCMEYFMKDKKLNLHVLSMQDLSAFSKIDMNFYSNGC